MVLDEMDGMGLRIAFQVGEGEDQEHFASEPSTSGVQVVGGDSYKDKHKGEYS